MIWHLVDHTTRTAGVVSVMLSEKISSVPKLTLYVTFDTDKAVFTSYFCRMISETTELKKLPLFEQCNHSDLEQLLNKPHKRQSFEAKSSVLRHSDPYLSLMAITEGTVEVRMGSDEGREIVVEHVSGPQLLAPIFLYAEDNSMLVEITTITDAVIWYINRDAFHDFMRQYPHIMSAFLMAISGQARFLAGKVRSFATMGLQGRVLEHLDNHGTITNIALVAEILGVARPSLSRILSEMQSDGHIVRTKEGFVRK